MKQLWTVLMLCVLLLSLAGCQQPELPYSPTYPFLEQTSVPAESAPTVEPTEPSTLRPPIFSMPDDSDFVRVVDYVPNIRQELAYATSDNFTGYRIYDFTDAYLRYGTVKKLIRVCRELEEQGLGLIIWDGFRPAAAQARLWEICPDPIYVSHPVTGKRTHCRGNTVDITLYSLATGEPLMMPTEYDNFTAYADRDYSDCSREAAENAMLLEQTMERHGFTPYSAEWWHFTDTQAYPIDELFNPAVPTVWKANCYEYISLWAAPQGDLITQIPKGECMELLSWQGKYARVRWDGLEGFVLSSYMIPAEEDYFTNSLDTVLPTHVYTYDQMLSDMRTLQEAYPDAVTLDTIGESALGREIPVLCLGNLEAEYHVLLQGAMHGREHLTAWLLMAMADYWLDHGILGYGDVCYHILPMVNPDGVMISQTGLLSEAQRQIYLSDRQGGHTSSSEGTYAYYWQANGEGVDINRNFPAGWMEVETRQGPSSQQFKGTAPFSAPEAAALRDYTMACEFDATVSYHATGSLIYYEYGQREPVNTLSGSLALAAQEISGYELVGSQGLDGAGYKDWAIEDLGIPSLTVEIGCEEATLAQREIYSVFVRNYRIFPAIARWLQV